MALGKGIYFATITAAVLITGFSQAQTLDTLRSDAASLIFNCEYQKAIPKLDRCLYFANKESRFEILSSLGDCHLAIDSLDQAHTYYQSALENAPNDSVFNEIIFKASAVFLKQQNPTQAINLLENKLQATDSKYINRKKRFHLALAHYQNHNYKMAQIEFHQVYKTANIALDDTLAKVFNELSEAKFFIPSKARLLSQFLPGLGQLYAKDYKNSLNSFALNAGLLGVGIYAALVYTPFDGLLWVAPWLRKYYIGGYKKAELIAVAKNDAIESTYLQRIMKVVEAMNLK